MDEGFEKNRFSVRAWAWTISICVHVILLVIFAAVKFSQWKKPEKAASDTDSLY